MKIQDWLDLNALRYKIEGDNIFSIEGTGIFLSVRDKDIVFDEDMILNLDEDEEEIEVDFYCYEFGRNFYYTKTRKIENFTLLKYLGSYNSSLDIRMPFLGIHGGYDILNGSRVYADWVKKAKFLGADCLGICEKNTLGGVLKFQMKCLDSKIRPVIGYQAYVYDNRESSFSLVKCYAKDERGWGNMLRINKIINVDNEGFIYRNDLLKLSDGLIFVLDPKFISYDDSLPYSINICKGDLFWQVDTAEFSNEENDKDLLLRMKRFMEEDSIPPILIQDAYYLDKNDYESKVLLNNIADKREPASINQYYKSIEEIFTELSNLFDDEDKMMDLFERSLSNLISVSERCKFNIPLKQRLLPDYSMTEEEIRKYGDKEAMFYSIVEDGIGRKVPESEMDTYLSRLEEEIKVISNNNFIDYFLILWDIVKFAHENDILVGVARGSAGGSLLAYVMDITQIDPIKYNLLFSRFLNEGRAKVSYPDIDTDFESSKREDIKRYMESKYGKDRVCSIGTYTNLKIKQALKDISKLENIDFETTNYISQILDLEEGTWLDIFRTAIEKKRVKDFILDHPNVIEDIQLILNQPKSRSIHACATLITPEGRSIYEWIPVRKELKGDEAILVSEWEGIELEAAGFLKEDILGIKQLDKYRFILNLIKQDTGETFDIYKLPVDDLKVYDFFQKGLNGDVFHFGSRGLTKYCKEMKSENIEDLIAAISLYRPGAMENNFHNEYILRKNGEKEIEYWTGSEEILINTYGLTVYQENIMQLCQVLGGLTLVEADDVRRAMVKKKYDELHKYEERFLKYYPEKFGVTDDYAKEVWSAIDKASTYLFNRSHAAAYAITGYIGQWLKVHYPLQYWTSAFQFDDPNPKKTQISRYIGEINKSNVGIGIKPPNINYSTETFTSNFKRKEIYWSLEKVNQVGGKTLPAILEERSKNGEFFSIEDFLERIDRRIVNKAVVVNFILSGAFDDIEGIKQPEERIAILRKISKYYKDLKINEYPNDRFWWSLKQREVSGFGSIDYIRLIRNSTEFKVSEIASASDIQDEDNEGKTVIVAGIINRVIPRLSKKNNEYCDVELDCNNEIIVLRLWSDQYLPIKEQLEPNKIVIANGQIRFYKEEGSVQSFDDTVVKIF